MSAPRLHLVADPDLDKGQWCQMVRCADVASAAIAVIEWLDTDLARQLATPGSRYLICDQCMATARGLHERFGGEWPFRVVEVLL